MFCSPTSSNLYVQSVFFVRGARPSSPGAPPPDVAAWRAARMWHRRQPRPRCEEVDDGSVVVGGRYLVSNMDQI